MVYLLCLVGLVHPMKPGWALQNQGGCKYVLRISPDLVSIARRTVIESSLTTGAHGLSMPHTPFL